MATAEKQAGSKLPSTPSENPDKPGAISLLERISRVPDAIFHFLASLKLAVISLSSLAATLAYATFFESSYGGTAAQEYIYRRPAFAILLAFLAMNILCAALIRYPWKKRQTGFVITHIGLLILLAGSYYSVQTSDEGQMGMLEGDVKNEMVRTDHPVIRVWEVDAHTQEKTKQFDLPFHPGTFAWGPGVPKAEGPVERAITVTTLGLFAPKGDPQEILTKPNDPFQFVVKEFLPASTEAKIHVADDSGAASARMDLFFKGPGMPQAQEAFRGENEHWFVTDKKFSKIVRSQRPALIAFSYVDRPELVEDFLKPIVSQTSEGVARLRYRDRSGKTAVYDWPLAGQQGKSIPLPDSDLTVTLTETTDFPPTTGGLDRMLGDDPIPIAIFKIQAGTAEPITHIAMANLPMVPNVIPSADGSSKGPKESLATIHYMVTPVVDPQVNGRFGQIETLAGPDGKLYYRVFGRAKDLRSELRTAGPLAEKTPIVAFGGNDKVPMTISFQVDEYLPKAIEKDIYRPVVLPKGRMGEGIAACRAEMTVKGETKELWLQRALDPLDVPRPEIINFGDSFYAVGFDVDRKPLDFELKLDDFEVGFEPGTEQATKFVSQVKLTDPTLKVSDQPHTIQMNEPLHHRGYTFYQMRYSPEIDASGRPSGSGRFKSIFQVAINPGRNVIYTGCLLVVLGAFTQFYMRAGVFYSRGKPAPPGTKTRAEKQAEADEHL
jgi:ResB-like family